MSLANAFEDIDIDRKAVCTLSDGTRLISDVYTPAGEGPFPVLLMRQPYGRDIASTVVYAQPSWFARQGYIVVIQDVRGRGDSEGIFEPFDNEREDGYESVEWAAKLPKSNRKVGMYGFSYQGFTQLQAAVSQPPSLVALAPHMTAFDLYSGWFYRDRILQLNTTLGWANQMLREDAARLEEWQLYDDLENSWANPDRLVKQLPITEADPIAREGAPPYAREWVEHDRRDDYWEAFNLLNYADRLAQYPMFHIAGWYDYYLRGSLQGYTELAKRNPDRHVLVCGPWVHIPWGQQVGDHQFRETARLQTDELLVKWFDAYLKEEAAKPPFGSGIFIQGEEKWRWIDSYPPADGRVIHYFLSSGGKANSRYGDGTLEEMSENSPPDQFNYDPEVPVLGPGCGANGSMRWGPCDLSKQQQSNDLLVYTSSPFDEAFTIAGECTCTLFVNSTASHTSFVARLSQVRRDNQCRFLCLGATLAGPEDLSVEGVFKLRIRLDPTAVTLFEGERLRLDLSSSAFPLLARHPNNDTSPNRIARACQFQRAIQIVHHSPKFPSKLTLNQWA